MSSDGVSWCICPLFQPVGGMRQCVIIFWHGCEDWERSHQPYLCQERMITGKNRKLSGKCCQLGKFSVASCKPIWPEWEALDTMVTIRTILRRAPRGPTCKLTREGRSPQWPLLTRVPLFGQRWMGKKKNVPWSSPVCVGHMSIRN